MVLKKHMTHRGMCQTNVSLEKERQGGREGTLMHLGDGAIRAVQGSGVEEGA